MLSPAGYCPPACLLLVFVRCACCGRRRGIQPGVLGGSLFPPMSHIVIVSPERRAAAVVAIREFRRWFIDRYGSLFCMLCVKGADVEVHHIVPVSAGGSDDAANLVPVCAECHKIIHQLWPVRIVGGRAAYGGPREFIELCYAFMAATKPERAA